MSCSVDSVVKTIKETPALSLAVVETPLGALGAIFLIITSLFGMQYVTDQPSLLSLFKTTASQIFAFLSPVFNRAKKAGTDAFSKNWSWLMVYFIATIASAGLLIAFSEDSITWLTVGVGILFAFGLVSVVAKYYDSMVANALVSGAIFGTSIFIVYFLIAQASVYTTGRIVPDFFFVFFIAYFLLSFIALGSIAGKSAKESYRSFLKNR